MCKKGMKKLIIIFFLFSPFAFSAEKCNLLYSDNTIELCAQINSEYKIYNKTVFSIFGNLKGKTEKYLISDEIDLEAVKKTKSLNNGLYYYKAFIGGNSVNAENRHVLIVAGQGKIYSAGEFSEVDKKSKFFTFVLSTMGKAHSMDEYEKKELILKNNKLVLK